jgi:FkbM family methyltransferase
MHYMSHTGQDAWVSETLKFKRGGFFLDFGGFEGLMHSNTFYLEKFLGWQGILVEPNPQPFRSACAVRSCVTINAALYGESRMSLEFTDSHGLSSFLECQDRDGNRDVRKAISAGVIRVDTINPTELLGRFSVPRYIDYLSLDVEGVEFEVIKSLDLDLYSIALMSIEHNDDEEKRTSIREHLRVYGYEVIEHWNDDLFFHGEHLDIVASAGWIDPRLAQQKVSSSYKMISY